jgi:hypothetical protein
MINPRDDCPHAYKLSPHFSEQIPSQEIPFENQSALQVMPHAAARFAGKLATTGKDRRRRPLKEGLGSQRTGSRFADPIG